MKFSCSVPAAALIAVLLSVSLAGAPLDQEGEGAASGGGASPATANVETGVNISISSSSSGGAHSSTQTSISSDMTMVINQAGAAVAKVCTSGEVKVIKSEDNGLGITVSPEDDGLVTMNCIAVCKLAGKALYDETEGGRRVLDPECKSYCTGKGIGYMPWMKKVVCDEGVISAVTSDIPTESAPVNVCVPDDELMKGLNDMVASLHEASETGDTEKAAELKESIAGIKAEIETHAIECKKALAHPAASSGGGGVSVISVDICSELNKWVGKRDHYASVINDTAAMLDIRLTEEQIGEIIEKLDEGISKLEAKCSRASLNLTMPSEEPLKPVAVENGGEIQDYYKEKVQRLMDKADGIDQKIAALKAVRQEIDSLIEELLRKKQELNASEMEGLVDEIKVTPNKIKADNVEVMVTDKKIKVKVKERELELGSGGGRVTLRDGSVNVTADELAVSPDGNLSFKGGEINSLPAEVVRKLKINANKIELMLQNDRPVYSISAQEAKSILGIIPVMVDKEFIVDASTVDADVLQEKVPWWAFLAF